jgi:4-hydroxy-tetrahydrodipicolinate synthase
MADSDQLTWARQHFRGLENILMPSFSPDLSTLDEDGIRRDVRQSKAHGAFSVFCPGLAMTLEEERQFLEIVVAEAAGEVSVGLPVTGNTAECEQRLKVAQKAGATHTLLHPPHSLRVETEDELYRWYRELIESTELPICLWATDGHQFSNLHPSNVPVGVFAKLAELPNVVALKLMTTLDPTTTFALCEATHENLLIGGVHLGSLPTLARNYGMQWSGAWTFEALQSPDRPYAVTYLDQLNEGRFDDAIATYWKMKPAYDRLFELMAPMLPHGVHPFLHLKYYQWCTGGNGGLLRTPDDPNEREFPLRAADRELIGESFRAIGIEPRQDDDTFITGVAAADAGSSPDDVPNKVLWQD